MTQEQHKKTEEIEALADEVMQLARDSVAVRFRFFDSALSRIRVEWVHGLRGAGLSAKQDALRMDPVWILQAYMEEQGFPVRILLHSLLHMVFLHPFQSERLSMRDWDLACDIAVESSVLEMGLEVPALILDSEKRNAIEHLSQHVSAITADGLYREFTANRLSDLAYGELN